MKRNRIGVVYKMKTVITTYLQENKKWIIAATAVFGGGMILGALTVLIFPSVLEYMLSLFASLLEEEIATMQANENLRATFLIFRRNLQATLVLAFGGLFFGLITFSGLLFNGFILGVVVGAFISQGHLLFILASLIPHGIFEIPALLFAGAWGFRLGTEWIMDTYKGKRKVIFVGNFKKFFKFLPTLVIILLIAAFIEIYVSGYLVTLF